MGAKHTPGPWSMSEPPYDSIPWLHVYGPQDPTSGVASHIMHKDRSEGEKIANARLIAAAPELLEALLAEVEAQRLTDEDVEMIQYHAAHGMDDATGSSHCFSAARRADEAWAKAHKLRDAAIAKATGAA